MSDIAKYDRNPNNSSLTTLYGVSGDAVKKQFIFLDDSREPYSWTGATSAKLILSLSDNAVHSFVFATSASTLIFDQTAGAFTIQCNQLNVPANTYLAQLIIYDGHGYHKVLWAGQFIISSSLQ